MKKNTEYLTPNVLESQETLSPQQLDGLNCVNSDDLDRPAANFIDLMNWTLDKFSYFLQDKENLNKFVHNKVIIDGQFLRYCEENKATVKCLYKDSIISWKTDHNYEKFFAQGVFLIKAKGLEFLHAALYHKGNNNEDEISFFVIVSNDNYEAYVKFRNSFDEWIKARDRSDLHVRVIDGEDFAYTKDNRWEDLFLPEDIKTEIKKSVENFLCSKDFYLQKGIPWKRGMILYGFAGCGKSSIIKTIMSEYDFKPVTIVAGATDDSVREAFSYAENQSPSLLYFEDLDSLLERQLDLSTFLNLMDGISTKNGLFVIATANEVKKLKPSLTQRPSRFDRKFEIPLPNQEMAYIYLKRWFGNCISVQKCKEIAKFSERYGFSYAYLKELYISSMFEAISHNRQTPTVKDIDNTLQRLLKEKTVLNSGGMINTDKYFTK